MQRALLYFLAGCVGLATGLFVSRSIHTRHASLLAEQRAQWERERASLQAALDQARRAARAAGQQILTPSQPEPVAPVPLGLSPREIIAKLEGLALGESSSPRKLREAVYWLEELAALGPAALPAIGEFLARYEDVELDTSVFQGRGPRDRVPMEFLAPPSLRFGLFDVAWRIGGVEAQNVLASALEQTERGVEVAYLARALEEMAPGRYRARALAVTHRLLNQAAPVNSASALDRNHREYLYGVLLYFGDSTFTREAQALLVQADSQVDRGALRYLQQVLGPQAVPLAAQAYQSPVLTNSAGKEPLARLALQFVGADVQANAFYEQAINDPLLTRSHRKNLIEDLNQDGFADTRNLKPTDLPLIENRMQLIEQLAPSSMDDANTAAFKEAYKDLVNMRAKLVEQPGQP